jgi:hypothetical protein
VKGDVASAELVRTCVSLHRGPDLKLDGRGASMFGRCLMFQMFQRAASLPAAVGAILPQPGGNRSRQRRPRGRLGRHRVRLHSAGLPECRPPRRSHAVRGKPANLINCNDYPRAVLLEAAVRAVQMGRGCSSAPRRDAKGSISNSPGYCSISTCRGIRWTWSSGLGASIATVRRIRRRSTIWFYRTR